MPTINKYNVYGDDGRIIKANISRPEIANIIGQSADYVAHQLANIARGQKEKIKDYVVECVLDRSSSTPNTEAKKLLDAEWDKTCRPFRELRRK